MSHPQLAALDLNLLIAFEALWEERSVTRAGRKLGLSQPAMSGALSRLREMMKDPLFVRGRAELIPTERCAELAVPLATALLDIRNALAGTSFDPATTEQTLTIGAVDAAIAVVIPRVAARFAELAPRALLSVRAIDPGRAVDLVETGSLDLALTPRVRASSTVKQRALFPLEFWLTVRRDHPLARGPLTPQRLAAHPRLQVCLDGAPQKADALRIRPTLSVSSFLAVPHLLIESAAWSLHRTPVPLRNSRRSHLAPDDMVRHPPHLSRLPLATRARARSRGARSPVMDALQPSEGSAFPSVYGRASFGARGWRGPCVRSRPEHWRALDWEYSIGRGVFQVWIRC